MGRFPDDHFEGGKNLSKGTRQRRNSSILSEIANEFEDRIKVIESAPPPSGGDPNNLGALQARPLNPSQNNYWKFVVQDGVTTYQNADLHGAGELSFIVVNPTVQKIADLFNVNKENILDAVPSVLTFDFGASGLIVGFNGQQLQILYDGPAGGNTTTVGDVIAAINVASQARISENVAVLLGTAGNNFHSAVGAATENTTQDITLQSAKSELFNDGSIWSVDMAKI